MHERKEYMKPTLSRINISAPESLLSYCKYSEEALGEICRIDVGGIMVPSDQLAWS